MALRFCQSFSSLKRNRKRCATVLTRWRNDWRSPKHTPSIELILCSEYCRVIVSTVFLKLCNRRTYLLGLTAGFSILSTANGIALLRNYFFRSGCDAVHWINRLLMFGDFVEELIFFQLYKLLRVSLRLLSFIVGPAYFRFFLAGPQGRWLTLDCKTVLLSPPVSGRSHPSFLLPMNLTCLRLPAPSSQKILEHRVLNRNCESKSDAV